jgi:uncharacterized protein (TIGR00730 family)
MASICVYCSSSITIDQRYVDLAADVGTELARRGHRLVSGGGDLSSMGAVARAARAGGAHTTGVIPHGLLDLEVGDQDADELLVVEDMRTRKGLMDAHSDAFLTLPGGLGTLEELLEVWVARFLGMHAKPVVVLDPDGLFSALREQVEVLVEKGFVRRTAADALTWTKTVAEALDRIESELGSAALMTPLASEMLESEPPEEITHSGEQPSPSGDV